MKFGRRLAASAVAAALCAFALTTVQPAGAAEPDFAWLCKPGRAGDPCIGQPGSLLTQRVTADGSTRTFTPRTRANLKKKIDCFYVYPTVSGQAGPNADLSEDPEIDGIAAQQAARFAPNCRIFAPIYRQFTVASILGGTINQGVSDIAYGSVKAAWDEYMAKYNKGRGIVLIGHSQGTGHLKRLISETFDRRPNLRKRLVSAVLIGGNVIVAKGHRTGGSFQKVPACSKWTELGCAIAYSSFLEDPPPSDSLFGRVGGALSESGFDPATHEIMCVNPARLDRSKGILKPYYETAQFPGIYGPLLPDLTSYDTPWVNFPNLYSASCQKADGASWLRIHDISNPSDARPRVGEPLGRTWGTHLTEVNDAAGNLVSVVTRQEEVYVKKLARRVKAKRKHLR